MCQEPGLSPEHQKMEAIMGQLQPSARSLDREMLIFAAGRAAQGPKRPWQVACGVLTVLLCGSLIMHLPQSRPSTPITLAEQMPDPVMPIEMQPQFLLHDGHQQGHPVGVQSQNGSAWIAQLGAGCQGLELHKNGTGALHAGRHHRAGGFFRPLGEKNGGWIRDLFQPPVFHFKHADLVGRSEPVFYRP